MYIHLGGDVLIKKNKIVAIIDLETMAESKINDKFLNSIKNNKEINYISENGKEKTLIITVKEHYLSPISATTLFKRGDLCETVLCAYDEGLV
ncbi:MAG: extracellular matrix/biofilm biosynthesis regulator RemA family protein [Desulfosporosinus sp.]